MFCLRSWLPLLFIPTNASPAFIFLFFVCTYFLNRPCVYCSVLLLILFVTSCHWSDRCFFDFSSNWFAPRPSTTSSSTCPNNGTAAITDPYGVDSFNATAVEMLNTTASALASVAAEELAKRKEEWTGLGIEWLRSLLGRREWRIECMDLYIRL
ncbi:bladder cancer-related protein BC10-domain-containing protein [Hypoxylon fragiforme]|uniref:bladder cancer-related protein BC10-domain-containing protein n=1 Tax=Hypoxylon fragiforme TaxID=63214 RepID=UPI0020C6A9C0|nr:bladder cancer-related protein BC10-domain-containing protein [Hypoxylon fragiforme]KAI2611612.1 bladder cancer-related protein BC10-domain-containing protein [Hypoxylon fragiforme]